MEVSNNTPNSNQYSLSIRFSSDGFSLLIYDESNHLLSSKNVPALLFSMSEDEIQLLITQEAEMQLIYKNVRLICELDNYTFIPTLFFRPKGASDFLKLQHKIANNEHVMSNKLQAWDVVNIFAIPTKLYTVLAKRYPGIQIEHHLSYFLTEKVRPKGESCIHIWVRPKTLDVVVLKNGNLTLINSYAYLTPEDFTYFTLNIFEQLQLETESCKVQLYNSEKKPELKQYIQKYVKFCDLIPN